MRKLAKFMKNVYKFLLKIYENYIKTNVLKVYKSWKFIIPRFIYLGRKFAETYWQIIKVFEDLGH